MRIKFLSLSVICSLALLTAGVARASVSFLGTALTNAAGLSSGDFGVLIIDNNNAGFGSISVLAGSSLTSSSTYSGFTVVGSNTATFAFSTTSLSITPTFDLGSGVDVGDRFAIIVFDTSTSSAITGDTYRIWTDVSWVVSADGSTSTFAASGGDFAQLSSSSSFTGVVTSAVPEPATYAALFGLASLGFCALRRRRKA